MGRRLTSLRGDRVSEQPYMQQMVVVYSTAASASLHDVWWALSRSVRSPNHARRNTCTRHTQRMSAASQ